MALGYSLGNPLTALTVQVRLLSMSLEKEQPDPESARITLQRMQTILEVASNRVSAVTSEFQRPRGSLSMCDINDLVQEISSRLAHQTLCSRLNIDLDLAQDLPLLQVDREQIARVVTELMLNAAEAMYADHNSDGRMSVRTGQSSGAVSLEVGDSGGAVLDTERIFELHPTTKMDRPGMRLSISRALVLANGGQLLARNNGFGGLTTLLTLPVPPLAQQAGLGVSSAPSAGG